MFYPFNSFPDDKTLVFYGGGWYAEQFVRRYCLEEKKLPLPHFFCDDNPALQGQSKFGVEIINFRELDARFKPEETVIVITAVQGSAMGIFSRLGDLWTVADIRAGHSLEMGWEVERRRATGDFDLVRSLLADDKSRRVFDLRTVGLAEGWCYFRSIYEPEPHFNNDVITKPLPGEVYIDGGAYPGDHLARFLKWAPDCRAAVGFDPRGEIFFDDPRVAIRPEGLSDGGGRSVFNLYNGTNAQIVAAGDARPETGDQIIETVRLDDLDIPGVSLIKLDVEGAEAAALRGARRTIENSRPRLSISAYHFCADLFELPLLIREMRPDYKFYLRHYSALVSETVLYAV